MMKKEHTNPLRQHGKSSMTLEQALAEADLDQIITRLKKLSDEEVCSKWKGLPLEAKEKVLAAARDSHGKKTIEQRVALAHAIAVADAAAATNLLQHALTDKAQARQSLGKIWFVESRGWIDLGALKMEEANGILPALIDVASDPRLSVEMKKTINGGYDSAKKKLYDFSRWAMPALAVLSNDENEKRAKAQLLIALSEDWPEEWRNELKRLADAASTSLNNEQEKQSLAPDSIMASETEKQSAALDAVTTGVSLETENQFPPPGAMKAEVALETENRSPVLNTKTTELAHDGATKEPADGIHGQVVQHPAPTSTPGPQRVTQASEIGTLINQTRLLIRLREEEIARKQAEAVTLTRLVTTLLTTWEENTQLKQRLNNAEERFTGLQNSNAQLEASRKRAELLRQEAEADTARLRDETDQLKRELAAARQAEENHRAEMARITAEAESRAHQAEANAQQYQIKVEEAIARVQAATFNLKETQKKLDEAEAKCCEVETRAHKAETRFRRLYLILKLSFSSAEQVVAETLTAGDEDEKDAITSPTALDRLPAARE